MSTFITLNEIFSSLHVFLPPESDKKNSLTLHSGILLTQDRVWRMTWWSRTPLTGAHAGSRSHTRTGRPWTAQSWPTWSSRAQRTPRTHGTGTTWSHASRPTRTGTPSCWAGRGERSSPSRACRTWGTGRSGLLRTRRSLLWRLLWCRCALRWWLLWRCSWFWSSSRCRRLWYGHRIRDLAGSCFGCSLQN